MDRLRRRIFSEVVTPTDVKSMKVVRVMSAEPLEQQDDKKVRGGLFGVTYLFLVVYTDPAKSSDS